MKILLDTCAYRTGCIEIKDIIKQADQIVIIPIFIGELLEQFKFGNKEQENINKLNTFLRMRSISIKYITQKTAEIYAEIHYNLKKASMQISFNDYWIAASAIENDALLITLDNHFEKIREYCPYLGLKLQIFQRD